MENNPEKLQFKPVTQGLGFQPFSDGMPYAPQSKINSHTPAKRPETTTHRPVFRGGAESAGPPVFIQPPKIAKTQKAFEQPKPALEKLLSLPEQEFGAVYVLKRMTSYLLDTGFNTLLCAGALWFILYRMGIDPKVLASKDTAIIGALFFGVFNWSLITAQEVAFSTSLGKRLFGLTLTGGPIAIFLRAFFFPISLGFFGLGILTALFHRKKRCWHDSLVDQQPLEVVDLR